MVYLVVFIISDEALLDVYYFSAVSLNPVRWCDVTPQLTVMKRD